MKRRTLGCRWGIRAISFVALCLLASFRSFIVASWYEKSPSRSVEYGSVNERHLLSVEDGSTTGVLSQPNENLRFIRSTFNDKSVKSTTSYENVVQDPNDWHYNCTPQALANFPKDVFTNQQRREGAIILHLFLTLYMFLALALVCDEYFVPSLEGICNALHLQADVAGATFMAAGSSAPELATTVIGVFIAKDDIGLGAVVGSADYNIMFVISMCALCARTVIDLNWWPLVRDSSVYCLSIILLAIVIRDERVYWYEAALLLVTYGFYVLLMAYNRKVERFFLRTCTFMGSQSRAVPVGVCFPHVSAPPSVLHHIHLVEEGEYMEEQVHQRDIEHQIAKIGCHTLANQHASGRVNVGAEMKEESKPSGHISHPLHDSSFDSCQLGVVGELQFHDNFGPSLDPSLSPEECSQEPQFELDGTNSFHGSSSDGPESCFSTLAFPKPMSESEFQEESLCAGWCNSRQYYVMATCVHILAFPLKLVLCFTIPDCRLTTWRRYFWITFTLSCLWIAIFSYLMIWMITIIGHTLGIPDTVMGLTLIAAGSSVPDAIASVLVVREGQGDMAVSNAVGSNVFDILLCMGLPWFLQTVYMQAPVYIYSRGLLYATFTLLSTVVILLVSMQLNRWRLTKPYGIVLLVVYFAYLVLCTLYELNVFGQVHPSECPLTD